MNKGMEYFRTGLHFLDFPWKARRSFLHYIWFNQSFNINFTKHQIGINSFLSKST